MTSTCFDITTLNDNNTIQTITVTFLSCALQNKIEKTPYKECERRLKVGRRHKETVAQVQSVQCLSQVDAVRAAHNRCWTVVMDGIVKHGKGNRNIQLITCDREKTFRMLNSGEKRTSTKSFQQDELKKN